MNGKNDDASSSRAALTELATLLPVGPMTPEQAIILRDRMREHPQWFVVEKSIWVTDRWHAIAGPYVDPAQAQIAAQCLHDHDMRDGKQDFRMRITTLKETVRIYQDNVRQLVDDLDAATLRRMASGLSA